MFPPWLQVATLLSKRQRPFCDLTEADSQRVALENAARWFIQQPQPVLVGSDIIVPEQHRETVLHLTEAEWAATFDLL